MTPTSTVAIVGAGWAGLAAAVQATLNGHAVTVFEATRTLGGRARQLADDDLDNGQHILIGAYTETLRLMRAVGVDLDHALQRLPLDLRYADGEGLVLPRLPAPWDSLWGIATAKHWQWHEKKALIRCVMHWRRTHFQCDESWSVQRLCQGLPEKIITQLIEPLCLAALNTPLTQASARTFLRVLQDALLGPAGSSHMLLPQIGLSDLFPNPAAQWLAQRGARMVLGHRVQHVAPNEVDGQTFDHIILACPPWEAIRLVQNSGVQATSWLTQTSALRYEAIATVYAHSPQRLPRPMMALRGGPAQFVFDHPTHQRLAFVASAVTDLSREDITQKVLQQAATQLGMTDLTPQQTVVEKRATFACTPELERPALHIAPGFFACGDYIAGPYPATLEGAVRSGIQAAGALKSY